MPISTARVQLIHNSADIAAQTVDIWFNDQLAIDNFQFRTATPFVDLPANVFFNVTIQPANSTDTTNGLARFSYNLDGGSKYILVANGCFPRRLQPCHIVRHLRLGPRQGNIHDAELY